ncbi:MAG: archaeosortase A [Thermoplasmata archaeon M8B2D]|nr:MAG: archaeosortase A [Thermoplasmata archaeon M8B2D]
MEKNNQKKESIIIASLFILIPTIFLVTWYYFFPYELSSSISFFLQIPMFLGLIFLLVGFFIKKNPLGNILKILGWIIFAFYWAAQPSTLYFGEEGDIFNAAVCVIGVYVLFYIAYHEWLSIERNKNVSCLNWIAGASGIAGLIYFVIERTFIADLLIKEVAWESASVLNLIVGNSSANGDVIFLDGSYVVTIIFACTAIQSMVIFIGMIGALPKIDIKRKIIGLLITVIPIYVLNLFRNALVTFLVGRNITDFNMAHNVISKAGSLAALIILLVIVVKIIPEVLNEILCLVDLHKRNGPIEKSIKSVFGRKK